MDKEFWKKRYKDKWKEGNKRELFFKKLMKNWGYDVFKYGFEALSDEYNPASPDEKGKPDFFITQNDKQIFFEITGTDSSKVLPNASIWLRPDKVKYIKKHKLMGFCCHILTAKGLARFADMGKINENNIIHPVIRGTRETYIAIDPNEFLSSDDFRKLLSSSL